MDILLAKPRGFCAGVDRAIDIVELALELYGKPVYMKHQIVHNTHVVQQLVEKGAIFVEDLTHVPDGAVTVFSAHGVPPSLRAEALAKRLRVIDATCPLVTRVHLEAIRYAREGYEILLVGHRGHVEMVGTMGEAPAVTTLVDNVQEARTVRVKNPDKVVVLSQTTLSVDDVVEIMAVLRERFPKMTTPPKGDICYATTNRQTAVKDLASRCDVVIVVGSTTSSNANRLREVAEKSGSRAYMINTPEEILSAWLDGARAVGVTSGASTPEDIFIQVVQRVQALGGGTPKDVETLHESVYFALPPEILKAAQAAGAGKAILAKHAIQQHTKMRVR
ncbi:MAG: 4-hydroxy-3-methylbut-2-enyl diphosphate reductase [Patescibacteria group bacterium]